MGALKFRKSHGGLEFAFLEAQILFIYNLSLKGIRY